MSERLLHLAITVLTRNYIPHAVTQILTPTLYNKSLQCYLPGMTFLASDHQCHSDYELNSCKDRSDEKEGPCIGISFS